MRTHFPVEFQKVLVLKSTTYTHLSKAMERRGYKLSKQFLCQIGTGARAVPALQLNRICETLALDEDSKKLLNIAACRDNGFFL